MKRFMFSIILSLVLFISSYAQQKQNSQHYGYSQTPKTVTYINWKLSNAGGYGIASFYWSVNKTYDYEMGMYKFNLLFSSNSFYQNGAWASTYIIGMYIYSDGYSIYEEPIWILFKEPYTSDLTSFYTKNPNPVINMTWSGMSIY